MSKTRTSPEITVGIGSLLRMNHESPTPDEPRRLAGGNASQEKFLSLFLRSEREIFRCVAALVPNLADAEDIVQQTAVALWEKFDAYNSDQPFTPWACGFAFNKARHWIERRQRWKLLLHDGLAEQLVQRREELRPELDQKLKYLADCLGRLPEHHKALVEGYYHHRDGVEQLAEKSKRTVAASYKMLQRVRQELRACIEDAVRREGIA